MVEDQQLQQQEQEPQQQQQQQQQQQSQQELAKLRAIDAKVKQVQDKLTSRLPHQRSHLAAMVCGTTWVNRVRLAKQQSQSIAASQEQYEQIVKKVRMELGAFDYQVKEQGELLTRYLCELDNILSFGNAEVKDARKALVVFIQSLLTTADEFRTKSAKLKEFGNKLMSTLPKPETQHAITEDAADDASEAQTPASPLSEAEDVDMKPLFADEDDDEEEENEEEEDEEDEDAGQEDDDDEESDQEMGDGADDMESEDEEQEDVQDVQAQTAPGKSCNSPRQSQSQTQQQKPTIDTRSLPVWRPYYQIQRRRDGLYLVANLRDVNPQNVRVQWNECTDVLHVSGHKLPTQKDIMVSRFSGVPTFGRFEITERLPANMLNMDEATQKVREDGTLEIRMPYYYCMVQQQQQQPRLFSRRGSLFDAPRCMVW